MAFALLTSLSALIPGSTGALFDFSMAMTIKNFRMTNTHTASVMVTLYFDYDGILTGAVDTLIKEVSLEPSESIMLDGGPWNFANGGRISGVASVASVVACHITPASI